MAIFVKKGGKVYIGWKDFSDHIPNVSVDASLESVDITSIADTTRKNGAGLMVGTMDIELFDDMAADTTGPPYKEDGSVDQYLNLIDAISSQLPMRESVPITVAVDNSPAQGSICYSLNANVVEHNKTYTIGDLAKVKLSAKGAGEMVRGNFLTIDRTISSATNDTGVLLGAIPTGGKLYAMMHVTGISSPSGITVNIQNSATLGGTYTTRGSFTAIAGTEWQMITINGPQADTYWRASWAWTSGSAVVTVAAGIKNG